MSASTKQRDSDHNRSKKLRVMKHIQQLLHVIEQPDFRGNVELRISGQHGRIGQIRRTVEEFDDSSS